jgi:hypothetical protein
VGIQLEVSKYGNIEARIADWAKGREDIEAVLIVGSRGMDHASTLQNGSDLDVIIFTSNPKWYQINVQWYHEVADVVIGQYEDSNHMIFAVSEDFYVIFKPDLDVDFSVVPIRFVRKEIQLARLFLRFPNLVAGLEQRLRAEASAFRLGFRTLFDRDSLAQEIAESFGQLNWIANYPSIPEYISAIDKYLVGTFKAIKKAKSGKVFHAKWLCDTTLKLQLIQMVKWHTYAQEQSTDPHRLLELSITQWADTRIKEELPHTFSEYRPDDIYRALYASLNLFYWVTAETSKRLGHEYQDAFLLIVDRIEWIREHLEPMLDSHIS